MVEALDKRPARSASIKSDHQNLAGVEFGNGRVDHAIYNGFRGINLKNFRMLSAIT